jgi:hypothetical protein
MNRASARAGPQMMAIVVVPMAELPFVATL